MGGAPLPKRSQCSPESAAHTLSVPQGSWASRAACLPACLQACAHSPILSGFGRGMGVVRSKEGEGAPGVPAPSLAAHGGAAAEQEAIWGGMGAVLRRQPPEDPFCRRLPPSSASQLNCRVRIDWECKWQLKCNLHSQQEQGGVKGRALGGWAWAGEGGSGRNGLGWKKPSPQPSALPQNPV